MSKRALGHLIRYGLAFLCVGLGAGIAAFLRAEHVASMVLLVGVTATAYFGGLGPSLLATGISALCLDYLFFPPVGSIGLDAATWAWLAGYVACAVLISGFQTQQRRAMAALRLQNKRKNDFVAVLAHELRNFLSPLSAALGSIKLRGGEDETIARACAISDRQLANMNQLVNDLLDVARIEQGKTKLSLQSIDLISVLLGAVEAALPAIQARGHRLETDFPADPLILEADATRLGQIFLNLLTNAAKYTEPGGNIRLTVQRGDEAVSVSVRDNGKGLSPEILPHVFDLFMQADRGATGGMGIGLSLVRRLVELHGGSIRVQSDGPGTGSEFVVRLPAKDRTPELRLDRTERPSGAVEIASQGAFPRGD